MASQSLVRGSVLKNEALYMRDCPRLCIRSATVGLPAYLRFVKRSGQVSTCHRHAWLLRIILFSLLYLLAEWRKLNVKFQCFWLEFNAPHNSHISLRFCPIILQRTRKKKTFTRKYDLVGHSNLHACWKRERKTRQGTRRNRTSTDFNWWFIATELS